MKYKNTKNILPKELVTEIQKYIQGDIIYIPIQGEKTSWGEKSGYKEDLNNRNKQIFNLYTLGHDISEIQDMFNLSKSSILKIISKMKISNPSLGGAVNE